MTASSVFDTRVSSRTCEIERLFSREKGGFTKTRKAKLHTGRTLPCWIYTAIAPRISVVPALTQPIRRAPIPRRAAHAVLGVGVAWFIDDALIGLLASVLVCAVREVARNSR